MRSLTALAMAALGEEFRRAREARGLTVSDVAERLHIRSVYLTAIEEEDWATIGPAVYIRGFMRTYARFLGLEPEEMVGRFTGAAPGGGAASEGGAKAPAEERGEVPARRGRSAVVLTALVIAAGLLGYAGYEALNLRLHGPAPVATEATAAPLALESPAVDEPVAAATGAAAAEPAATPPGTLAAPLPSVAPGHGLTLRVTETSWLRVTVDGKVVAEGVFPPGTVQRFAGKQAAVRIGNAGGVTVEVNGRALGKLGRPADVIERQFALGEP